MGILGLAGSPTVTAGVVSALNRSIRSERGVSEGFVQTDAAINRARDSVVVRTIPVVLCLGKLNKWVDGSPCVGRM